MKIIKEDIVTRSDAEWAKKILRTSIKENEIKYAKELLKKYRDRTGTKSMNKPVLKSKIAPDENNNRITCYYYGDKDESGKAVWFDINGKSYELMHEK